MIQRPRGQRPGRIKIVGSNPTPGTQHKTHDISGAIFNVIWGMKRDGYKDSTIRGVLHKLRILSRLGDLDNPREMLERILEKEDRNYQVILLEAYRKYLRYNNIEYPLPKLKREWRLNRIPTEEQVNLLYHHLRDKVGLAVKIIAETGIRPVELSRLTPRDFDYQQRVVYIKTAKGGNPRVLKVSDIVLAELRNIVRRYNIGEDEHIFPNTGTLRRHFQIARNRLAERIGKPELRGISLYSLRHFKATMLYRKTKDILYVKEFLGHRCISNTIKYIHLAKALETSGEYICKVAKTVEEAKTLIEAGFEYVCEKEGVMLFRKPK